MNVYITGFNNQEKTYLTRLCSELSMNIEDRFTTSLDVVVISSILHQKFRIAKILKLRIVKKEWLEKSQKEGRVLPPEEFEFAIFEGLNILLYGFDPFKQKTIEETALANKASLISSIDHLDRYTQTPSFIVYMNEKDLNENKEDYEKIYKFRTKLFIVSFEWFLTCLKENRFIYIDRFTHPLCKLTYSKIKISVSKKDIENLLVDQDVTNNNYNIFEDCVFYFFRSEKKVINNSNQFRDVKEISVEEQRLQEKIVNLLGGFSVNKRIKNITHVVSNALTESEMVDFNSIKKVSFVNTDFVKDCLLYKKRLIELEYPSFVIKTEENNRWGTNSITTERQVSQFMRNPSTNNFRSSMLKSNNVKKPNFKSFLFDNLLFYFDKNIQNVKSYQCKIIEHSGSFILELKNLKGIDKIFYVLDDGYDKEMCEKIKNKHKNIKITWISPRWIDHCLETKLVVKNLMSSRLPHLLPFGFKMPLRDFTDKKFVLKGFNVQGAYGLKELIKIMGGNIIDFNDADRVNDIIICDKQEEYDYLTEYQARNSDWLFNCINQGKLVLEQNN